MKVSIWIPIGIIVYFYFVYRGVKKEYYIDEIAKALHIETGENIIIKSFDWFQIGIGLK